VSVGVGVSLNFDTCYRELTPYGAWYESPEYGWIWAPSVGVAGWRPYTQGYWVCTSSGWMWRSNYPWGWLCYHYGRWVSHPTLGWCWVPGYEWAPAWVTWYSTDTYVGWAPIPPVGFGVSYTVVPRDWYFVNFSVFLSPYVWNYYVGPTIVGGPICAPYVVYNNYYFFGSWYYRSGGRRVRWYGPPVTVVERHVNRRITPYNIVNTDDRTRNGVVGRREVEVYRPGTRNLEVADRDRGGISRAERVERTGAPTGERGSTPRNSLLPATPGERRELPSTGSPGVSPREKDARGSVETPRPEKSQPSVTPRPIETPRPEKPQPSVTPRPIETPRPEKSQPSVTPRPIETPRPEKPQPSVTPRPIETPRTTPPPSGIAPERFQPSRSPLPVAPRTPAVPSVPTAPRATPSAPRTPAVPSVPSAPRATPSVPRTPAVPSIPSAPRATPSAPRTPAVPSMPSAPRVAPSMPRMPSAPSTPSAPRVAPSMPRMPSAPSMPSAPRVAPSMPRMPSAPSMPSMPRVAPNMPGAQGLAPSVQMSGPRR
jgi:hypothetical protein